MNSGPSHTPAITISRIPFPSQAERTLYHELLVKFDNLVPVYNVVKDHVNMLEKLMSESKVGGMAMVNRIAVKHQLKEMSIGINKVFGQAGSEIITLLQQIDHFISEIDNIEKRDMVHDDNDNHPIPSDDDEQGPMPAVDDIGHRHGEPGGLNWRAEKQFWMAMDKLLNIIYCK